MPAFDGGDDFVWICGPGEGFWVIVGLVEEAVEGGLEVDDGAEDAAFEAALRQLGEEPLDRVQPRAGAAATAETLTTTGKETFRRVTIGRPSQ